MSLQVGAAYGPALAVALSVAGLLQERGTPWNVVALPQHQRRLARSSGSLDLLVSYEESGADGTLKRPPRDEVVLAPAILGHVLAIPSATGEAATESQAQASAYLSGVAEGFGRIVTEIPSPARDGIVRGLELTFALEVPSEAFLEVPGVLGRRAVLRQGIATSALLTSTDPTMLDGAHSVWTIATSLTHRITVEPLAPSGKRQMEAVERLIQAMHVPVVRELQEHIGEDVLQGRRAPAIPTSGLHVVSSALDDDRSTEDGEFSGP